jgi:glutathione peroxidase
MFLQFFNIANYIKGQASSSIHQFSAKNIQGEQVELAKFKGKKILVVNTASKCGLTPQFEKLQQLHTDFKDLVIIGFPSNDFAKQDPGNNKEIESFCQNNYGVEFIMMEKIHVKGDSIHPIYKWLTRKNENGVMNSSVKWNFQKYLIDEQGHLNDAVAPWRKPDSSRIINWINKS